MKRAGYSASIERFLAASADTILGRLVENSDYAVELPQRDAWLAEIAVLKSVLDGKGDVRSSYYLEDVATEFHVQGLELDYACITWDADLRHNGEGWDHWSFVGDRWNRVRKPERQVYLKNACRVLLTRARQGMVIVVPEGDATDPTRHCSYYDATYDYLRGIGIEAL